jgi:hypothetical protein
MVHTTEELLAERQAKIWLERKEQLNKDERILYERVKSVDPSLLAATANSNNNKQDSKRKGHETS